MGRHMDNNDGLHAAASLRRRKSVGFSKTIRSRFFHRGDASVSSLGSNSNMVAA